MVIEAVFRLLAENLVAAYQGRPATLLGVAETSTDAKVLLQALEIGTDGIVFRSNDAAEVYLLIGPQIAQPASAEEI